jgi:hypothetical protein
MASASWDSPTCWSTTSAARVPAILKESEDKVWLHPDAIEKNYYVNDAGRLQVGVPWNLEDYFDFFQRTEFSEDYDLR